MKRKVRIGAVVFNLLLLIVLAGGFYFWHIQEDIVFHANYTQEDYENLKENKKYEEIIIPNDEYNYYGWFYKNTVKAPAPLVIFFQGNYQNSSHTFVSHEEMFNKYFAGYNVLIMDYPTFGKSEGRLTENQIFKLAELTYDYAISRHDVNKDKIVIMGYSIGTGPATYLASKKNACGLILLAPYDRMQSIYNKHIDMFYGPLKFLIRYQFDSIEYAKDVEEPTQIITSKSDEVINYTLAENLSKKFRDARKILVLENEKHNDYFSSAEAMEKISKFLEMRLKTD